MAETIGINVVFTDLVGSTEMSSRLGPEATEELRVVHFGLLRGAVEPAGGVEVKNLGDGLMVVFPSLGSALDGSVAMQQAIERHNATGKEPLGVRVGISTGDATEEDGDYFGDLSLLLSERRKASVKALTYCDIFVLPKADFERIKRDYDEFREALKALSSERSEKISALVLSGAVL